MITELVSHATLSEMDHGPTDPGRTWCECKDRIKGSVEINATVKVLPMNGSTRCKQPARIPKTDGRLSTVSAERQVSAHLDDQNV